MAINEVELERDARTDRPLDQLVEAAIFFRMTGDHLDKELEGDQLGWRLTEEGAEACGCGADPEDCQHGYWSDEDKDKVERLAEELPIMILTILEELGWQQG